MKSRLKFRGIHNGGWKKGFLSYNFKTNQHEIVNSQGVWPVISETVGQYTGCKDKNGVEEVFDDIVEHVDAQGKRIGIIAWDAKMCCMCIDFPCTKSRVYGGAVLFESAKIIGNVYETPQLLEGK